MVTVEARPLAGGLDDAAAELMALKHPAVPRFLAAFAAEGRYWLIQEYLPARTMLKASMEVLDLVTELLAVLAELHRVGVVHGALSPSRVVVDDDDLYLVGWSLRLPGEAAGNESYAAPEQERGETGPAADVYSAGALAVRLITGRRFERVGDDWTERVHPRVAAVLIALLDPDPGARPTAAEAASLFRALGDLPEPVRAPSTTPQAAPAESAPSRFSVSLVEVMIAVAIIGVLAAVAIPALVSETESEEPANVEAPALAP